MRAVVTGGAGFIGLTSLGCDLAQGYYIAKPTAAADLTLAQHLVA